MKVLVIGAGPAGCTAAIALSRRGVDTVVVEIEPELRASGRVVESSVQLGEWEQRPPVDPSEFGRLTGRALGALAQPY